MGRAGCRPCSELHLESRTGLGTGSGQLQHGALGLCLVLRSRLCCKVKWDFFLVLENEMLVNQ